MLVTIQGNWGPERLISYPRSHSLRRAETIIQGSQFSSQDPVRYSPIPLWYFSEIKPYNYSLYNSRVFTGTLKWLNIGWGVFGSADVQSASFPLSLVKPLVYCHLECVRTSQGHRMVLFTHRSLGPWWEHLCIRNTWFPLFYPWSPGLMG